MLDFNRMKIKNKILMGYVIMSVLCFVMTVILYITAGISSGIGIAGIVIDRKSVV